MYLPGFFVVLLYPKYVVRRHIEFYAGGLVCQYFWRAKGAKYKLDLIPFRAHTQVTREYR